MKLKFIPIFFSGVVIGATIIVILWVIYECYIHKSRKKSMDKFRSDIKEDIKKYQERVNNTMDRMKKVIEGYKELQKDKNKLIDEQGNLIDRMIEDYKFTKIRNN